MFYRIQRDSGQNLNELAIILGLVVLIGIGMVMIFGRQIQELLLGSSTSFRDSNGGPVATATTVTVSGEDDQDWSEGPDGSSGNTGQGGSSGAGASGGGEMETASVSLQFQPHNQMVTISDTTGVNGGSNTTSELGGLKPVNVRVEVGQDAAVRTLKLAAVLQGLANAEADVKARNYFQQLAQLSYYLGGVQGELDDIPGLELRPDRLQGRDYTNGDALRDLVAYSGQLNQLLNTPPAGLDSQDALLAKSLGREVYKTSTKYRHALSEFLDDSGIVVGNWANFPNCELQAADCPQGGHPGYALSSQKDKSLKDKQPIQGWQYDQLVSFNELVARANGLLAKGNVLNREVKLTFQYAAGLNRQARSERETAPLQPESVQIQPPG